MDAKIVRPEPVDTLVILKMTRKEAELLRLVTLLNSTVPATVCATYDCTHAEVTDLLDSIRWALRAVGINGIAS